MISSFVCIDNESDEEELKVDDDVPLKVAGRLPAGIIFYFVHFLIIYYHLTNKGTLK